MNAPIRDAFDCSSRKPMRRHFVSGFPRALLSLSQEKSSGVEIEIEDDIYSSKRMPGIIVQVFLQIVAFFLQTDRSGRPVLTKRKRPWTRRQM